MLSLWHNYQLVVELHAPFSEPYSSVRLAAYLPSPAAVGRSNEYVEATTQKPNFCGLMLLLHARGEVIKGTAFICPGEQSGPAPGASASPIRLDHQPLG